MNMLINTIRMQQFGGPVCKDLRAQEEGRGLYRDLQDEIHAHGQIWNCSIYLINLYSTNTFHSAVQRVLSLWDSNDLNPA